LNRVPTIAEVMESDYFAKGLAVCQNNILNDSVFIKFRDEQYELPSRLVARLIRQDQSRFDSIRVEKVRSLAREQRKLNG
jgi:hypothetical protein